jgi:MoaA/NifB/PqqE/SkfB family radical SAM enzyme
MAGRNAYPTYFGKELMLAMKNILSKVVCRGVGGLYDLAMGPFPAVVRIETTNACNAKCIICPHGTIGRPIQHMDDGLFEQIIDECAQHGCKEVHLHNFGEPLMDKKLETRVAQAKGKGLKKVKIFSNGSLLSEQRAEALIDAGLDEIKISFDGATREEFERIRAPLKFDTVVANIKSLVALRDRKKSPMAVHVACCSTTDKQGTMDSLESIVDGFSFGKIHNWAGDDSTDNDPAQNQAAGTVRKPCSRLWRTCTVLASGDVSLCCLDYDGQHVLGHLDRQTTIRDVWRSDAYKNVRSKHKQARQAELSLCQNCTKAFV